MAKKKDLASPCQNKKPRKSQVTATVGNCSLPSTEVFNSHQLTVNRNEVRTDQRPFVFLYSVSKGHYKATNGRVTIEIPECRENERYRFITSFPERVYSVECTGDFYTDCTSDSGVRVVVDLINPDNVTNDLDKTPSGANLFSIAPGGRDLAKKGVFYSLSNPPKLADIVAAERRLGDYYKNLWECAITMYWSTGKSPENDFGYELSLAAKYLEITSIPWNLKRRKSDKESI